MIVLRRAFSSLQSHVRFPKLVIFDLDHTLWPFGVDSFCFTPPFHYDKSTGNLIDMNGKRIDYFPDTPKVLQHLTDLNVPIAVASRTRYPYGARTLLEMLKMNPYVKYDEIYPGQKTKHFGRLQEQSGVAYQDMMFFDDEARNITDISALGVHSVLVDHNKGATLDVVKAELAKFSQQGNA